MRIAGRLARLEAQGTIAPAPVRAWTDMLTRLRASFADYAAWCPDEPAMHPPVYQVSDAALAAEARFHAGRGTPATLTDWFQSLQDIANSAGEGGDDAATDSP